MNDNVCIAGSNYKQFLDLVDSEKKGIKKILNYVNKKVKFDFRGYRDTTMYRRISRRFFYTKSNSFEEYYKYIKNNNDEIPLLINSLTINVTSFFRDKQLWQKLEKEYLPIILKNILNSDKNIFNIWQPGCSSGEETYSLAIILNEYKIQNNVDFKYHIISTDIDTDTLTKAEKGIYLLENFRETKAYDYIFKYFDLTKDNNYVETSSKIKNCITFKFHSLINDLYNKNIDFIVCRNVFIYFHKYLQNKILRKMCSSLKKGGFIWLGKSESYDLSLFPKLKIIDKDLKLFQKV